MNVDDEICIFPCTAANKVSNYYISRKIFVGLQTCKKTVWCTSDTLLTIATLFTIFALIFLFCLLYFKYDNECQWWNMLISLQYLESFVTSGFAIRSQKIIFLKKSDANCRVSKGIFTRLKSIVVFLYSSKVKPLTDAVSTDLLGFNRSHFPNVILLSINRWYLISYQILWYD